MRRSVSVCSSDDPTPPATNSITEALRVRSPCREQQLAAGPTLAAAEWPRVNSAAALSDFWRRTAALLWVLILAGHLLTAPGAKAEAHWAGLQHERPGVSWQRWADWYHSVLAFASNSGLRPYSERHQRTLANTNTSACRNFAQCLSLTPHTVADICSEVKLSRIGCLRRLNLFGPSPCLQRYQLNLENLFLLHVRDSHELEDPTLLTHLTPDTIADCLLSGSGAPACHRCFAQLLNVIDRVQLAFEQFDMVLKQVDCRPGQEEIFSLRSSCEECQARYKEWLLVTQLSGSLYRPWKVKPCLNYCEITELYCPHLKNTDTDDYAGLPTFRCSDPHIEPRELPNSTYPLESDCIRPCWMVNGINEDSWYCRLHGRSRAKAKLPVPHSGSISSSTSSTTSKSSSSADSPHRGFVLRIFPSLTSLLTGPISLCVFYYWQLSHFS